MNIHVHASWSPQYAPLAEVTWTQNKLPYARANGYIPAPHKFAPDDRGILWGRVAVWLDLINSMPDGDWLFFTGCDAAITNPGRKLEEFTGDYDFYCGLDQNVVHGDCWLMRACGATRKMLEAMLAAKGVSEQHAFVNYLHGVPLLRESMPTDCTTPAGYDMCQELLNNSPVRCCLIKHTDKFTGDDAALWPDGFTVPKETSWTPEHLVLHVGGKSNAERIQVLSKYAAKPSSNYILLTHYSQQFAEIAALTDPSKVAYCQRWGLDYVKVKLDIKSGWDRPPLWKKYLQGCDGVFFMGADALITNLEVPPRWDNNLTISLDADGFNSDVFFMRNTPIMDQFLSELITYPDKAISEQDAMLLVLTGHKSKFDLERAIQIPFEGGWLPAKPFAFQQINYMLKRFKVEALPIRELSAYPLWMYPGKTGMEEHGWHPGDFVLHASWLPLFQRVAALRTALG